MHFETRRITLRDGRECVLCPAAPEYAQEVVEYMKSTAAETPFLLRYPDEVSFTAESEREFLAGALADERSAMMLALVEGRLAGLCSFNPAGPMRRIRHRCSLGIAILKAYWGLGIGSAMMGYLEELAGRAGYEQMELEVTEGNEAARRLYERKGYIETGRHPNAMKYDDGAYRDDLIMSKRLISEPRKTV